MDDLSDERLVAHARAGDEQALRVLTERYMALLHPRVTSRLPAALRRRVQASDILQEAHLVALRQLDDFEDRGDGSYRRWLRTIVELKVREAVRHHCGAELRDQRREVSESRAGPIGGLRAQQASPSQAAVGNELRDAALRALDELPPDYRRVLGLLQRDGRTIEEAAAELGRSVEATRRLYGRALARLEGLLGIDDGGAGGRRRPTR